MDIFRLGELNNKTQRINKIILLTNNKEKLKSPYNNIEVIPLHKNVYKQSQPKVFFNQIKFNHSSQVNSKSSDYPTKTSHVKFDNNKFEHKRDLELSYKSSYEDSVIEEKDAIKDNNNDFLNQNIKMDLLQYKLDYLPKVIVLYTEENKYFNKLFTNQSKEYHNLTYLNKHYNTNVFKKNNKIVKSPQNKFSNTFIDLKNNLNLKSSSSDENKGFKGNMNKLSTINFVKTKIKLLPINK